MNYENGSLVPVYDYSFCMKYMEEPVFKRRMTFGEVSLGKAGAARIPRQYVTPLDYYDGFYLDYPYHYDTQVDADGDNMDDWVVCITCMTTDPDYMEEFRLWCLKWMADKIIGTEREKEGKEQ